LALTSDMDQESEQRWAAARGLAEGVPDRHMRGRRRRVFALLVALLLLGWVGGAVLAVLLPPPSPGPSSTDGGGLTSKYVIGYGFALVGFVVGITGFIWAKRTGRYVPRWRQVISPLNRQERKWAIKQLRGKIPPDPSKLDILLTIARQSRSVTEGVVPLFAAPALMNIGLAITADADMLRWLQLLAAALFISTVVTMAFDYPRWGTFLDKHGRGHDGSPSPMR
jgi:MFS family permease